MRTDHGGALTWLLNFKNPEGQVARWLEVPQTYNSKIVHRPGKPHGNSDKFSHRPCSPCNHCDKKENNYKANDADDNTVLKVKEDYTMNRSWGISKGAANISNISKNHQVEIRGPQTNLTGSRKKTNNVENLLLSMESTNVDK